MRTGDDARRSPASRAAAVALSLALPVFAACDSDRGAGDGASGAPSLPDLPEPTGGEAFWLSQTGLYRDIANKLVAPELREFEPAYPLWSDGLDKRRWLRLPAGTRIDVADMNHWRFPVGAMLFKEFSSDGRRIETRLIARTGPGTADFWMGAFVWNEDESDARFVPGGERDAGGTRHDVPSVKNCGTCHNGEPGRVLGFSAVQQPDVAPELVSEPVPPPFVAPGDPATAAALGYLHANCASCHNPGGSARPDTDMDLRLSVADRSPEETRAHHTTVDRPLQSFADPSRRMRVAPGAPDESGLLTRMTVRGDETQMPPIASEEVDEAGVALVRAWIEAL